MLPEILPERLIGPLAVGERDAVAGNIAGTTSVPLLLAAKVWVPEVDARMIGALIVSLPLVIPAKIALLVVVPVLVRVRV